MADGGIYLTLTYDNEAPFLWSPEDALPVQRRLMGLLEHLRIDDDSDEILAALLGGWGDMLERAALVAYGDPENGIRPWQVLTDPAVAPLWALPHAVMYTGGRLAPQLDSESDDDYLARAREEAIYPRGMWRGSARAMEVALKPLLTGTRYVRVIQRYNDDVWQILVIVKRGEAADEDAVRVRANDGDLVVAGTRVTLSIVDAPIVDEGDELAIDAATLTIDDAEVRANWEAL